MKKSGKPIIIEFNGITGCGKTTTANLLVEKLTSLGYEVGTFENLENSNKIIKNINFLFDMIRIKNLKIASSLIKLCVSVRPFKIKRFDHIGMAYNYYYLFRSVAKKYTNYDYIIIDQGLIQEILSIFHTQKIMDQSRMDNLLELIFNNLGYFLVVNCNLEPSLAKRRIKERNSKKSRLDLVKNDEELLYKLRIQQNNLEVLREVIEKNSSEKAVEIDMDKSPSENIEKIIEEIL